MAGDNGILQTLTELAFLLHFHPEVRSPVGMPLEMVRFDIFQRVGVSETSVDFYYEAFS